MQVILLIVQVRIDNNYYNCIHLYLFLVESLVSIILYGHFHSFCDFYIRHLVHYFHISFHIDNPTNITPNSVCVSSGDLASFTCATSIASNALTWTINENDCSELQYCSTLDTGNGMTSTIQVNTSQLVCTVEVECVVSHTATSPLGEITRRGFATLSISPQGTG